MVVDGGFHFLIADTDVTPGDVGGRVLEKVLNEDDIVARLVVDVRGVPLSETVGADVLIAEIVADELEVVLNLPNRDGEQKVSVGQLVTLCVVAKEIVNRFGNSECAPLPGFLLHGVQPPTVAVPNDVCHPHAQNVAHPHTEVRFSHEDRGNSWVRPELRGTVQKSADDGVVLNVRQRYHILHPSLLLGACARSARLLFIILVCHPFY